MSDHSQRPERHYPSDSLLSYQGRIKQHNKDAGEKPSEPQPKQGESK